MNSHDSDEMTIPMIQPSRSSAHRTVSSISSHSRQPSIVYEETAYSGKVPGRGFPYSRIESTNIEQQDQLGPSSQDDPMIINKIFAYLSIYCVVMILINFIDIGLLLQISNSNKPSPLFWINGPSALVTIITAALMAFYIFRHWSTLRALQRTTSKRRRSAWISVVLTMLLPVLFCQFGYMNLIAFPRFNNIIWDSSIEYRDAIMPPVLSLHMETSHTMVFGNSTCRFHQSPEESHDCSDNLTGGTNGNYSWVVFNPKKPVQTLEQGDWLWINIPFWYSGYDPERMDILDVVAFDPSYMDDLNKGALQKMSWGCNFWATTILDLAGHNTLEFERKEFTDPEEAAATHSDDCAFINPKSKKTDPAIVSSYGTYDLMSNHYRYDDTGGCVPSTREKNTTYCESQIRVHYKSNMVSTQTSRRGTDWVKILTDESGIAGGIVFFTWFLSIYIV